jgi:hypothetical protein
MHAEHVLLCPILNPLLNALEKKLTGVKIGRQGTKMTMIAYADDVTIVVSKSEGMPIIRETLKIYKGEPGQKLTSKNRRPLLWAHGTHACRSWT